MSLAKLQVTTAAAIELFKAANIADIGKALIRYDELWDRQPYLAAGYTNLPFFSRTAGSVSDDDSNLRSGKSEMPNNEAFLVCAVSVGIEPTADQTLYGAGGAGLTVALDDYLKFQRNGRVVFKVGNREEYVEVGPMGRVPPSTQPRIGGFASDSSTAGGGQRTLIQDIYTEGGLYLITPKVIKPGATFEFSAKWAAQLGLSANAVIEGRLYGFRASI